MSSRTANTAFMRVALLLCITAVMLAILSGCGEPLSREQMLEDLDHLMAVFSESHPYVSTNAQSLNVPVICVPLKPSSEPVEYQRIAPQMCRSPRVSTAQINLGPRDIWTMRLAYQAPQASGPRVLLGRSSCAESPEVSLRRSWPALDPLS